MASRKTSKRPGKHDVPEDEVDSRPKLPLSIHVADARTLVLLLNSPEPYVYHLACEALASFAEKSEENRILVSEQKGIPPVVDMLSSDQPALLQCSAHLLSVCCREAGTRLKVRKLGGLPKLVKLLESREPDILEHAVLAVALLCVDFAAAAEVVKMKGIESLVALLQTNEPTLVQSCILALNNCSMEYTARVRMRELNAVPLVLSLLISDSLDTSINSAQCLANCCQDFQTRIVVNDNGGIKVLVGLLGEPQRSHIHSACAAAIAHCLEERHCKKSIREAEGLLPLITLLAQPNQDVEVTRSVTLAIARALIDDDNRRVLWDQDGLELLVPLLDSEDKEVLRNVTHAFANCIENVEIRKGLHEIEVIGSLVGLLDDTDSDVQSTALACLASFSQYFPDRAEIRTREGIQRLLPCLESANDTVQLNAATCLASMVQEFESRVVLRLVNGVSLVLAALANAHMASETRAVVGRILAGLAHDKESREQVLESGELTTVVALLSSQHVELRRTVEWALSLLAEHEGLARQAVFLGAIERLQTLIHHANGDEEHAHDAMVKVLKRYLPAQYGLTDHLGDDDIIGSGFYDSGHCERLEPLENLLALPVDKKREVLWVNPVEDPAMAIHLAYAMENVLAVSDTPSRVRILGQYVADVMGGACSVESYSKLGYQYVVNAAKVSRRSNVLPIGLITKGAYYHRALLFKVLGDAINVPSTLTRGEFTRAWNTVRIEKETFMVDLMYQPGRLMPITGTDAANYMRL